MTSTGLHEDPKVVPADVVDRHRAIQSLMEELEAIDWYDQRVSATKDPELAQILAHNRDEEKEHAAMLIAWLCRHDAILDQQIRERLSPDSPENAAGEIEPAEPDGFPAPPGR